jgi:hypothetical protein
LADLEAELFAFPGSKHDDQCDSISQALIDKNYSMFEMLAPEQWRDFIAKIARVAEVALLIVACVSGRVGSVGCHMERGCAY